MFKMSFSRPDQINNFPHPKFNSNLTEDFHLFVRFPLVEYSIPSMAFILNDYRFDLKNCCKILKFYTYCDLYQCISFLRNLKDFFFKCNSTYSKFT